MFNKIGNKLKSELNLIREKAVNRWTVIKVGVMTGIYTILPSVNTYAAGSYTKNIDNTRTVMLTLVASIGGLVFVYGIVKFAESFQKKDQNGEYAAIYTIVAGGVLCAADLIYSVITG